MFACLLASTTGRVPDAGFLDYYLVATLFQPVSRFNFFLNLTVLGVWVAAGGGYPSYARAYLQKSSISTKN
jgi:hypothetical protein